MSDFTPKKYLQKCLFNKKRYTDYHGLLQLYMFMTIKFKNLFFYITFFLGIDAGRRVRSS